MEIDVKLKDGERRCPKCGVVVSIYELPAYQVTHSNYICKSCRTEYWNAWCRTNRSRLAGYKRKFNYGMCAESYALMFAEQGGVCKICGNVNKSGRGLHVDHNHSTGTVRGLLCSNCNTAIGLLKEDPSRIEALKQYLLNAS